MKAITARYGGSQSKLLNVVSGMLQVSVLAHYCVEPKLHSIRKNNHRFMPMTPSS